MVFEKIDFDFEISNPMSFKSMLQFLFYIYNVEFEFNKTSYILPSLWCQGPHHIFKRSHVRTCQTFVRNHQRNIVRHFFYKFITKCTIFF